MRAAVLSAFAICLLTFSLGFPPSVAQPDRNPVSAVDSHAEELRFSAHKMTMSEMLALRDAFGVRDYSADYNVLVDGYGTGLAPPTEEGWLSMVGTVNVLDSIEYDLESLPTSYDLSSLPTFPAVGNQQTQPSCSAWAAAYYAYGFQEAVDQDWDEASEGAPDQLISPAWTYNKVNGGTDSGSWMDENMMVLADWGAATLETMPYDQYDYLDWGSPPAFREAPAHRAAEAFTIEYSDLHTIDQIKALVVEGIPVTFAIDAQQYFKAFIDNNTIVTSVEYSSSVLNHAQTIVGFDDGVTDDGEVGAFRVVNSWGTTWGDDGYYWFTYDAMRELGDTDLAVINYVTDIEDYSPAIVATWHFNTGPSRGADLELGLGSPTTPVLSKSPFFVDDKTSSHLYPAYMCLDITEFAVEYGSGVDDFYIGVGASPSKGYVSSFKIVLHEDGFVPGSPTHSSGQSGDVPAINPCTVTNSLHYHALISADEAMDAPGLDFVSTGATSWVPVNHHSHDGVDSMQSGDVADGESTHIQVDVEGPADVSFFWKASSQSGDDILSFSVPGSGIEESVSGDADWQQVEITLEAGTHTLVWSYSKGSLTSSLEDTAWIDSLVISSPMPSFSLEATYSATYGSSLLVTPLDILNPVGGDVSFWYVWGDGYEGPGDPGVNHSASHVYLGLGGFDLVVHMEDSVANNVSRYATVNVVDANLTPEILSIAIDPAAQYHEPGCPMWINVTVADAEGDVIDVLIDFGDESSHVFYGLNSDPGEAVTVSAQHSYDVGDETPYVVNVTVSDDASHASSDWRSETSDVLVNTPPVASFTFDPPTGGTGTLFSFDASACSDAESALGSIEVRWDWDGDGVWDTSWSTEKTAVHSYASPGAYDVALEARDANGLISSASTAVQVTGEPIDEFPFLLVPVLSLIAIFAVIRRRVASKDGAN